MTSLSLLVVEGNNRKDSDVFIKEAFNSYTIKQGFLNRHKNRTVRVRLKKDKGYLTVKGKSSESGLTRFEWEKEISKTESEALLELCEKGIIDKIRYEVKTGNHTFEIDIFFGDELHEFFMKEKTQNAQSDKGCNTTFKIEKFIG